MELKSIEENIQSVFADSSYPREFLDEYDQMECLASHNGQETFLLRKKDTGEMAVAKCYDRRVFPFRPGPDLLADVDHPGLPRLMAQYQNEKMLCIVREYIEGEPLSDYARERQLSLLQITDLGSRLCDILTVLHSHEPPIIHRDIKPENVIVRPDGTVALIDFDISRFFKEEAGADTYFYGTRGYAPPEQYGFGQTDCRTDLYALGVLLRWLITGSVRNNQNVQIDRRMQRIIDRCTAFSPEERYENAAQVRSALREAGSGKRPVPVKSLLALTAALLTALCLGFAAGRYTGWLRPVPTAMFMEPLIERAVRLQLGRESGPLSPEDLLQVREMYIYGREVYKEFAQFSEQRVELHEEGPIRTLDDFQMLPNLQKFCIGRQGYVDVSRIANLGHLESLELKHMRISGAQPIGHASRLKYACLFDCGLSDVTALENCPWLEVLDVGLNNLQSLRQIGTHPSVRNLGLTWLKMNDVAGIADSLLRVETVTLQHSQIRDLSGLTALPHLEAIYVLADQEEAVRELFSGTDVNITVTEN